MSWAQYEVNHLDEARSLLLELLEHRFGVHARAVVEAYGGLALISLAQGDKESAGRAAQQLRHFLLNRGLGTELLLADILDVRVALSDPAFVPSYSEVESLTLAIQSLPFSDLWCEPRLTAARANLRLGRRSNLDKAAALLDELQAQSRLVNNRRKQIQAAALACLVQAARGEQAEALASLKDAVLMGEHVGTLRSIAEAGPGILPYLQKLLADNVARDYVIRLIALLDSEAAQTTAESMMPGQRLLLRPLDDQTVLKASLTNRELDVLQLVARRFTNKEIASALSVSPNTVRKHTANIYKKLGVNNRREAAIKAKTLDILQADA
jgi:ATP/maltotriose-dependent transcriptional regulator MalT